MDTEKYFIFHIDGGIGKNIAATAVCKSIKAKYPDRKLVVVSPWPEVFLHNPNVYRIYRTGNFPYFYEDYIKGKDTKVFRMEPYHSEDLFFKRKHLIQIWCDLMEIPCLGYDPEIHLTEREIMFVGEQLKKDGPNLLIQSYGGAENQPFAYGWGRDLPPVFANDLINTVKGNFSKIYQIRRDNQPAIQGTIQITHPSIRIMICNILFADKILAIDSFIQHAAAALKRSATVAWIANSPVVFGYDIHDNIFPREEKGFRHQTDSYLEETDWTGSRLYECPYNDIGKMFDKDQFVASLLGKKQDLVFDTNVFNQPSIQFS